MPTPVSSQDIQEADAKIDEIEGKVKDAEAALKREPSSDIASAIKKKLEDLKILLQQAKEALAALKEGIAAARETLKEIFGLIKDVFDAIRELVHDLSGLVKDLVKDLLDLIKEFFKALNPFEKSSTTLVSASGVQLNGRTTFSLLADSPSEITMTFPHSSGLGKTPLRIRPCSIAMVVNSRHLPGVPAACFEVENYFATSAPVFLGERKIVNRQMLDGAQRSWGLVRLDTGAFAARLQTLVVNSLYPLSNPIRVFSDLSGHLDLKSGVLRATGESFDFLDPEPLRRLLAGELCED